jgi:hypothetical protein
MNSNQLLVKMVLDRWNAQLKQMDELLATVTDEQLQKEIAPGKNRGIYLVGHLAAVHDDMLPLLRFSDRIIPSFKHPFLDSPDRAVSDLPPAKEVRAAWKQVSDKLREGFNSLNTDQWFERHNSISPEDFVKEPHRNRLNVVIGRISHLSWHQGQLEWIK